MNRIGSFSLVIVAVGIGYPGISAAQTPASTRPVPTAIEITDAEARSRVVKQNASASTLIADRTPNDRAMAGFNFPSLKFTTESGETSASFAFSFDLQQQKPEKVEQNYYRIRRTRLSIVTSAPIEEGKTAKLISGDSLLTGGKVKISVSRLSNRLGIGRGAASFIPQAYQACIADQSSVWTARDPSRALEATAVAAKTEIERRTVGGSYEIALSRLADGKGENAIENFLFIKCAPGGEKHRFYDETELVEKYTKSGREFADLFYNERSALRFIGADASIGQDDFGYLDQAAFENTKVSRTGWEVGAYAGIINWNSTFSARGRAVLAKTWKLPDEVEVCRTLAETGQKKCLKGPDGMPKAKKTGIFSFETRHLFAIDAENSIGIAPQLTYRLEDRGVGIEVPVYLSKNDKGALDGGLKFNFDSKKNDFSLGVFVGLPFSIFY